MTMSLIQELHALRQARKVLLDIHQPAIIHPDYPYTTWVRYLVVSPTVVHPDLLDTLVCAYCDSQREGSLWPCAVAAPLIDLEARVPSPDRDTKDVTP